MKDLFSDPVASYERGIPKYQKVAGKAQAAANNTDLLDSARALAIAHAAIYGEVSIDDVREALAVRKIELPAGTGKRNFLGSVFDKRFERVGYKQSTHAESHGRVISIWKLSNSN